MSGIETALLISAASSLVAGGIGAAGTIAQGNAEYAAAKSEQIQLNRMASEELAAASREAEAKGREAKGLTSRVQAVAASSGGMATDNSILENIGNIAKTANVQTRDILRSGQVKADDLMYRGRVGTASAKYNRGLARWTATGQMIGAVGDAFGKYGQGASIGTSVSPSQETAPWYSKYFG